jgi:cell division protein FtsL
MNISTSNALQQFTQAPPKAPVKAVPTAIVHAHTAVRGMDGSRFTAIVLFVAVVASGVMLVWSRYEARRLFQALESLSAQHDEQQIEWGRLQLEQATWSENSRIEQIARERLGLDFPEQTKVVVIKQ